MRDLKGKLTYLQSENLETQPLGLLTQIKNEDKTQANLKFIQTTF